MKVRSVVGRARGGAAVCPRPSVNVFLRKTGVRIYASDSPGADGLWVSSFTKVAIFVLVSPRPLGITGEGEPVS